MISETKHRVLAVACGVEWYASKYNYGNPSFSSPDDWELVRVNVVVPNIDAFCWDLVNNPKWMIEWWLTLSPEECCELAADFILANLDLFPTDVQEKIREILIIDAGLDAIKKTAEKFPPESSQIISGKRMPWEEKPTGYYPGKLRYPGNFAIIGNLYQNPELLPGDREGDKGEKMTYFVYYIFAGVNNDLIQGQCCVERED